MCRAISSPCLSKASMVNRNRTISSIFVRLGRSDSCRIASRSSDNNPAPVCSRPSSATAFFELLAAAAGAWLVSPDLLPDDGHCRSFTQHFRPARQFVEWQPLATEVYLRLLAQYLAGRTDGPRNSHGGAALGLPPKLLRLLITSLFFAQISEAIGHVSSVSHPGDRNTFPQNLLTPIQVHLPGAREPVAVGPPDPTPSPARIGCQPLPVKRFRFLHLPQLEVRLRQRAPSVFGHQVGGGRKAPQSLFA